jgi:hypothetical protein
MHALRWRSDLLLAAARWLALALSVAGILPSPAHAAPPARTAAKADSDRLGDEAVERLQAYLEGGGEPPTVAESLRPGFENAASAVQDPLFLRRIQLRASSCSTRRCLRRIPRSTTPS